MDTPAAPQPTEAAAHLGGMPARLRTLAVGALVVAFGLFSLSAGLGLWLQRNTLNDEVWAKRVVPLGADPAVQAALATWTTDQVMQAVDTRALVAETLPPRAEALAVPLSAAVEGFVADRVDLFFASERFEQLWALAVTQAHDHATILLRDEATAIAARGDRIEINLLPVLTVVLADILEAAPALVGSDANLPDLTLDDIPADARAKLTNALGLELDDSFGTITVYDSGTLESTQEAVRLVDRSVPYAALVAVATAGLALALSRRRRRTLLQLLGAFAVICIIVRRASFKLQGDIEELVTSPANQPAAKVVLATFLDPLTHAAEIALWLVALVALVCLLTGPSSWARRVRTTVKATVSATTPKARDDLTTAWATEHADALRVGGYVAGAAALWFVDLTWLSMGLVILLVAGWQLGLSRISPATEADETHDAAR